MKTKYLRGSQNIHDAISPQVCHLERKRLPFLPVSRSHDTWEGTDSQNPRGKKRDLCAPLAPYPHQWGFDIHGISSDLYDNIGLALVSFCHSRLECYLK